MFDKLANSFALAKSSWQTLVNDKKLLVFPIVSGVCCLLVLATFATPFLVKPQLLDVRAGDGEVAMPWWVYPVGFAYYFCNYFVVIFCNTGLITCALMRFNGQQPTLADGFRAAKNRLPQIAAWAVVAATVGMILKAIERDSRVGRFVGGLLGMAWTIMTYFVVPVIVVERVGPVMAVKRSMEILRKAWGEALIGNWGIGLFTFVLFLPAILLIALGAAAFNTAAPVGIAIFAAAGLYILLWAAVSSAMHGIYISALYQFAVTGTVPAGFDRAAMGGAFSTGRKSSWI
jgi:hypothetical protein